MCEEKKEISREAFCKELDSVLNAGRQASNVPQYIFFMTTEEIGFYEADSQKPDFRELYERGLEIRIFDEKSEDKWFRASIDKEFKYRKITDEKKESDSNNLYQWDEEQYLDIDEKRTEKARQEGSIKNGKVFATGGGEYNLPIENYKNQKLKIRNYLGEDTDTGALFVKDWRMAGFGQWRRNENAEIYQPI